jgi:hypothetical protein
MKINSLQSRQSTGIRNLQLHRFLNFLTNYRVIVLLFLLMSCSEIKTNNTTAIYKYWAGTNPSSDIELLQGQYWQSAHWTGEYVMYLKFKSTGRWWDTFLKKQHLVIDNTNWTLPADAPRWFKPSKKAIRFGNFDVDGFDQGARYFRDPLTQVCYIYEIQL